MEGARSSASSAALPEWGIASATAIAAREIIRKRSFAAAW